MSQTPSNSSQLLTHEFATPQNSGLITLFRGQSRLTTARAKAFVLIFFIRSLFIERELASRADQRVLRWFGHVGRMDEYRMARRVLMAEVSGERV